MSSPKEVVTATKSEREKLAAQRKEVFTGLAERIPSKEAQKYVKKYAEHAGMAAAYVEMVVMPLIIKGFLECWQLWLKYKPWLNGPASQDLVPALFGFLLCFFGGFFPTLIPAYFALRVSGWDTLMKSGGEIVEEINKAYEAHRKDEKEQASESETEGGVDHNHVQMSQKMMARKALLFARVVDPTKVNTAFASLASCLMAVLATLKLEFAHALTLGASMSEVVMGFVESQVQPKLEAQVSEEYRKWVPIVLTKTVQTIVVAIALALQKAISAVHSALRGGRMLGVGLVRYLHRSGVINYDEDESLIDEFAGYGCALLGFMWQASYHFGLPFPFSLILLPFEVMEWSLQIGLAWLV